MIILIVVASPLRPHTHSGAQNLLIMIVFIVVASSPRQHVHSDVQIP